MSDLTELRRLLDEEVFPYEHNPEWERVVNVKVVDAARRVANPDIEAALVIIYELRYIKDADEWDDKIVDITRRAVAASSGITKNTDA